MRCKHCGEEIGGPIVGPKVLMCPECGGDLVQLDLIFSRKELEVLNAVIDRAIEDAKFRQKLLEDVRGTLTEAGIKKESIEELLEELGSPYGLPIIRAT